MNKELIKKYFEEFNNWLNGGKVISKYTLTPTWSNCQSEDIWRIPDKNISKVLIVIDDEYVEFRKAGAEGKQLQVSYNGGKTWFDKSYRKISWSKSQLVRIKPEPPKFKVGDWVIHNGVAKIVTKAVDGYIDSLDNEVAVIMKEESLELWEPRGEEYFWYKNDLVKFHETQANLGLLLESARGCSYYPAEKNFEDFCEPFIGNLPSNLKRDSEIYKSNNKKETNERN